MGVVAALLLLLPVATTPFLAAEAQNDGGGGFEHEIVLRINDELAKPTQSFEAFDSKKMNLFDFNGDGVKEIVARNDNNWIYVFDSRTGTILAEMRDSVPSNWRWRELGGIAIGDVTGNGRWNLVAGSSAGAITVWELDLEKSTPDSWHFEKLWSKHISPTMVDKDYYETNWWSKGESTGFDGAPYLADITGNGKDEIVVQADNVAGHYVFKGDGTMIWGRVWDDGNGNPWVADLDRDGKLEAIFATDAGRIWVYDAATGRLKWKFEARNHDTHPGSISVAPGLIDVTGDGRLEVVFGARHAIKDDDPNWYMKQNARFFAIAHDGRLVWNKSFSWGNPHVYMHPAAVDVNGDGVKEAVFVDWNTVGHKPGNWERTGNPNLFAVDRRGNLLMHTQTTTYFSNKDLAVADLNGDGRQEIILNEGREQDGLGIFSLQGERLHWFSFDGWSASRGPVVADLYGQGTTQIVVAVGTSRNEENYRNLDVGYRHGALLVYDFKVPFDAEWDGNFLFNHRLDHLYGGANTERRAPIDARIERVDGDEFAIRIETPHAIERVSARAAEGGEWMRLTKGANETWVAEVDAERIEVLVELESGVQLTRVFNLVPEEPDDHGDDGLDDNGGGPGNDRTGEMPKGTPAPGIALVACVIAVAGAAAARRRA